jgi:intein-encoded DNA endonuclease-like protein
MAKFNTLSGAKRVRSLPYDERARLYRRALELRKEGLGKRRIAQLLGISELTVSEWLHRGAVPPCVRHLHPRHINLEPSEELAFLVGAVMGDGSIILDEDYWRVVVASKDLEFLEAVNECLKELRGRTYPIHKDKHCGVYRIAFCSVEFAEYMHERRFLKCIEEYPEAFIRGAFDAEATVNLNGNWLYIIFRVKSKEFANFVKKCLELTDIPFTEGFANGQGLYRVTIAREEALRKYAERIGFTIKRKKERLDKWLKERER